VEIVITTFLWLRIWVGRLVPGVLEDVTLLDVAQLCQTGPTTHHALSTHHREVRFPIYLVHAHFFAFTAWGAEVLSADLAPIEEGGHHLADPTGSFILSQQCP
jgi:hypothetical protein